MLRRSPPFRAHQATALLGLALVALAVVWAQPARADFRSIQIVDNAFQPDNIVVQLGDTVVWQDTGDRPHGVRSDTGLWDSNPGCSFSTPDPCMKKGQTFSYTFQQAGTFAYHCPVHGASGGASAMSGQVTVASTGGGGTTTAPTTTTTRKPTTTTAKPTTTAAPTTTRPGATTISTVGPPSTSVGPTVTAAPRGTVPVPLRTGTTLVAVPTTGVVTAGGTDRTPLVIVGLVVLAAALATGAWYYRPGRPPAA